MIVTPFGDPQAHGTLANTFVLQRRRGHVFCRKYIFKKDLNTSAQQAQRTAFLSAVALWNALPQGDKDAWNALAIDKSMTGYNLFIQRELL